MSIKKQNLFYAIALAAVVAVIAFYANQPFNRRVSNFSKRSGPISSSSEILNVQKAAEYYRFRIRRNPESIENYARLAQVYLQQARITGRRHAFISKADRLLDQALRRNPNDFESLLTRASVWLSKHQFEKALATVGKALAQHDFNAFAWGVKSDALKELGRYAEAVQACDKMLSIRPDLRSYARAAHLREIHGDLSGARQAMKLAADAGAVGLENHAWTLYQLGNLYFAEGKLDTAGFVYNGILQGRPNYPYALQGLAKIHTARGEAEAAIQKLLRAYDVAPEHVFMEELVKVYRASGQTGTAEVLTESVLEAFRQHEAQGWNVNLEFARFCAEQNTHLQEALQRMEREFARRPNHLDVLETYAWLLYRDNRPAEAAPLLERVLQTNPRNAKLHYRAGMIALRLGRPEQARAHFDSALVFNPEFVAAQQALQRLSSDGLQARLQKTASSNLFLQADFFESALPGQARHAGDLLGRGVRGQAKSLAV